MNLTEAELQQYLGHSHYKRAANYLASGKVSERTVYRNGVLTGYWDDRDVEMMVWPEDDSPEYDCECNAAQPCDHSATLALAWARQPETFTRVDGDYDVDSFGIDAVDGADDFLDDFPGAGRNPPRIFVEEERGPLNPFARGNARPAPAVAPAPVIERISSTLTVELEDMRDDYRVLLNRLNLPQLRELAARRGVSLTGNKREPILETLAEALGRPQSVTDVWPTLSAPARLTLGLLPFLVTQSGVAHEHLKQAMQMLDSKAAQQIRTALVELSDLGLLLENEYEELTYAHNLVYLLPPAPELAPPLAPQAARGLREVSAPGPAEFAQLALRLLLTLKADGARLHSHPAPEPHPLQTQIPALAGWPFLPAELDALARERSPYNAFYSKSFTQPPAPPLLADDSHTALARALNVPAEQLEFALRLLVKMGLVMFEPGRPPAVLEAGFLQYLSHHPIEHLSPLFNAWVNLRDWLEFDLPHVRRAGLQLKRRGLYSVTHAQMLGALALWRVFLLHQIRRAPVGQWVDLPAFIAQARAFNLLHALWPASPGLTLEREGRALNLTNAQDWQTFYKPMVEATLTGPLHWQGAVDLAYRKDQLVAFRLTALGAFLTYQTTTYQAPPFEVAGRALTYTTDPNKHLPPGGVGGGASSGLRLQPLAADRQVLGLLSLLGEVHSGPHGELDYQITVAGAARAFEAGWDAERILAALEKAAGAPPPAGLAQPLRQWWAHFGDVHLYHDLALIELADDYALAELLANTSLAQYLLYRFSPRLIALRPEGVETLRAELVSKGYTPKMEE